MNTTIEQRGSGVKILEIIATSLANDSQTVHGEKKCQTLQLHTLAQPVLSADDPGLTPIALHSEESPSFSNHCPRILKLRAHCLCITWSPVNAGSRCEHTKTRGAGSKASVTKDSCTRSTLASHWRRRNKTPAVFRTGLGQAIARIFVRPAIIHLVRQTAPL